MFIGLCFLTYGTIMHETVWREKEYFNNCAISIHPKYPMNVANSLKMYITYPLVDTKWGDRSIVEATLIMLFNLFNQYHYLKWFILCSEDSYPLKDYTYVEKSLLNKQHSQFDLKRASQWFIMCRKDVELLINAPKKIINFVPVGNGAIDELFFVQVLKKLGSKLTQGSSHYVKWSKWVTAHPVIFNKMLIEDVNNSFFIRKTFPTFTPKIYKPSSSKICYIVCIGTESIQNYSHLMNGDIYILSMISPSLVDDNIKNNCIQFYYAFHKNINIAEKILTSSLKRIYDNVIFIDEDYTENTTSFKINYTPIPKQYLSLSSVKKQIAFIFLTIDDINHPIIWTNYFKNHTNILIYSHPKNPHNVKTPWLKNAIINKSIPTQWGFIVGAYLECLKQAYIDGASHFITISESCLPIYSLDELQLFLNEHNCKTSFINYKRIGTYDLNVRLKNRPNTIKHYMKHDARFCLSRYHVKELLNTNPKELEYFMNTQVGDEFFLSVLDDKQYINRMAITYDNWLDVDKEVTKYKKIINDLTVELPYMSNKEETKKTINELTKHIDNIRKNPITYTEINNSFIKRAYDSGSFFWRKFPKNLDVSDFYTKNATLIYNENQNRVDNTISRK
jgi:hypothetical protein